MKIIYLFLTILILGGTTLQQKEAVQPIKIPLVVVAKVTDSMKNEYLKAAKSLDSQTDLLIFQKKKLERENLILKREVIRLKLLISNKPNTTFLKKESFFKRLFKKRKKKKKIIETPNDY